MPIATFSPPCFSSKASSSTMFMNTCIIQRSDPTSYNFTSIRYQRFRIRGWIVRVRSNRNIRMASTYIVTSQDTNDFAVAVQLAKYPLFHVLVKQLRQLLFCPKQQEKVSRKAYLLQLGLSLRHLGYLVLVNIPP